MPHSTTVSGEVTERLQNIYLSPFQPYYATTVTGASKGLAVFVYMGVAGIPAKTADIVFSTSTAQPLSGTVSWAEMGVFRGNMNFLSTTKLTKLGVVDVSKLLYRNSFSTNYDGMKLATINLDIPIRPGDHLWFCHGISAQNMPWVLSTLGNASGGKLNGVITGVAQQLANTRPSTLTGPFDTTGITNINNSPPILAHMAIY